MRPSGVMNGPPSNSFPIVYDELRALAARGGLAAAWNAADPGKGYDARAEQWRAKLPVNAEEQANDAGPSGGDESGLRPNPRSDTAALQCPAGLSGRNPNLVALSPAKHFFNGLLNPTPEP